MSNRFSWTPSGQDEGNIVGSRLADQIAERIGLAGFSMQAQRDIALLELLSGTARVFSVHAYGAKGNGVADDSRAIVDAAAALQAAGGGTLYFPPGTYRVFSTDYLSALGDLYEDKLVALSDLTGVRIEGPGAKIYADRAFSLQEYPVFLEATGCVGVTVEGLEFATKDATTWTAAQRERGLVAINALGGCRDIKLRAKVTGGRGFRCRALAGAATADRTIGVTLDLTLDHCAYGIGCNFSGDDLTARLVADSSHRAYFVYGVKNHRVHITSKNQDASDCIVGAFEGEGCENMDITYTNVDSDAASSAAECCRIQFGDTTAAEIKNVSFKLDIRWNATGQPGHGFEIGKFDDGVADTTDRGHVIKGLTLSGRFRDDSAGSASPTKFTGTWGAGETFSAWVWKDIVFDGTNTAQFLFDSLTDHALVQNVVGDCNVSIRGNATGRINVVSCDAVSLCASSADVTSQIQYYGCHISSALNQPAASEKIVYHGTTIDGQERNNLSNTEPSNTRPTLTLNGARIFGGVDSLTDLGTSAVDLNGGRSFGNGVVHFRIRTIDSHQGAFSLYIGFESGTAVVATTTGAGNCTVTPTGNSFAVVVDGDSRTYTFLVGTGSSTITLAASSTATGTTEVGFVAINA